MFKRTSSDRLSLLNRAKLQNHAAGLMNHQQLIQANGIVRLWHEAGLPIKEAPQTPPSQVN
jgi:hypothetical protein